MSLDREVGEIKSDLKATLAAVNRIEATLCAHIKEDSSRLGSLEAAQHRLKGAAWAAGLLATGASTVFGWLLRGPNG